MKVGDYYRTKYGINKLREGVCVLDDIIKSSPNIIDLIEVGDYVNGEKVTSIQDNWLGFGNYDYYRQEYEIKSIVTKEQFESMEYKVGD